MLKLRSILLAGAPILGLAASAGAQTGGPYDLSWSTIDGGGVMYSSGGVYTLGATIGQPDAGLLSGGATNCLGGFWGATDGSGPCWANCDNSTTPPILNVQDFTCFINKFSAGDPYANCDNSSVAPILNVQDFSCFLNRFAAGCS